jgi:Carboxypeptidase regulatory-like domain
MQVQGKIVDTSGKGIPSASVAVQDGNGHATGEGTITDSNGNFFINSSSLDDQAYGLYVSSIGYESQFLPGSVFESGPVVLQSAFTDLPAVVITAAKKSNLLPVALAAGGVLLLTMDDKKKKGVGKINTNTILIAGAVGLGGLLIYNLLKSKTSTPAVVYKPATPATSSNSTAQIITAVESNLPSLINSVSELF